MGFRVCYRVLKPVEAIRSLIAAFSSFLTQLLDLLTHTAITPSYTRIRYVLSAKNLRKLIITDF